MADKVFDNNQVSIAGRWSVNLRLAMMSLGKDFIF